MTEHGGASIPEPSSSDASAGSRESRVIMLPSAATLDRAQNTDTWPPSEYAQPRREPSGVYYVSPLKRRVVVPVCLFVATAISTFWAGSTGSTPDGPIELYKLFTDPLEVLFAALYGWRDGLTYMAAVMAILLAHELGHFFQALRYGVPASLPFFIPMPLTPLGTMGAVIAMRGSQADRRELFDIGLSGPLAGLLIAIPVAWMGIAIGRPGGEPMYLGDPLVMRLMIEYLHPELRPAKRWRGTPCTWPVGSGCSSRA